MKIVILDGYTLNPGDLDYAALERFGELDVYDRTPAELIVERARDAEIVLTNKTPLREATLRQLPKLRYIGVLATGYDVVDIRVAASLGVPVTNVPGYSTDSVAQLVFALTLELCHRAGLHSDAVHDGAWTSSPDFCFALSPLTELGGKTMGIVGFGTIGRKVAAIAKAFGMRVAAYRRSEPSPEDREGIDWVSLEELLRVSDVVSLHCPLTPDTAELINAERLSRMKPTALLINTARGKLIAESELASALREGRIAGAAMDVLSTEPPAADNPLIGAPNCIITPHIAWATKEARGRLLGVAVANVEAFCAGAPRNVVNNG